jgi:lipoprotein signal peptidase
MLLDKCFIKRYIKFNFLDKKILITKLIILFGVIILELIMIIPTYLAVANMPNSTVGKESDFLHILVITNTGVSFSFLQNAPI